MKTQQVIDQTINRMTEEIQDKIDAATMASLLASPMFGSIQQAPLFRNFFGESPAERLRREGSELSAHAAALQHHIDSLKNIIGI